MSKASLFRVEGKVQGVWFRESTRQVAEQLGLTGYAVNLPDGSVEVLACGSEQAVGELETWLQDGPPLAAVAAVVVSAYRGDWPDRFTTGWSRARS